MVAWSGKVIHKVGGDSGSAELQDLEGGLHSS